MLGLIAGTVRARAQMKASRTDVGHKNVRSDLEPQQEGDHRVTVYRRNYEGDVCADGWILNILNEWMLG